MKKIFYTLSIAIFAGISLHAQRYFDYVFEPSEIEVTYDIPYSENFTALTALDPNIGRTVKLPITLDLYMPADDTAVDRPLIIYLHTGNFLPVQVNGGVNGTTRDSSTVFACMRLARLGYVVASADYRLGWLPTHPEQTVRNFSLINAAYRGVQDVRTAVRFFRKSVAEQNNPYGIDPDKIVLWGQGTGGYLSVNTAALNSTEEIVSTSMPPNKFISTDADGNPVPMVQEAINGDQFGTSVGITPENYVWPPTPGDTLCISNHEGYSSDISMFVNMGGALGDISWIDENTPPGIFFQVPSDQFAPYDSRVLTVPTATGGLPVVNVQGSYLAAQRLNELGINDVFSGVEDEYTQAAQAASAAANNIQPGSIVENGHEYLEGLFPFNTQINQVTEGPFTGIYPDASPWDFWDAEFWSSVPNPNFGGASYHQIASLSNPNMSKEKSLAYIDSCVFYFAPRAAKLFEFSGGTTSTQPILSAADVELSIAPNPATGITTIRTGTEFPFQSVSVYSIDGRRVYTENGLNTTILGLDTEVLAQGIYIVQLKTKTGLVNQKLVVQQ